MEIFVDPHFMHIRFHCHGNQKLMIMSNWNEILVVSCLAFCSHCSLILTEFVTCDRSQAMFKPDVKITKIFWKFWNFAGITQLFLFTEYSQKNFLLESLLWRNILLNVTLGRQTDRCSPLTSCRLCKHGTKVHINVSKNSTFYWLVLCSSVDKHNSFEITRWS